MQWNRVLPLIAVVVLVFGAPALIYAVQGRPMWQREIAVYGAMLAFAWAIGYRRELLSLGSRLLRWHRRRRADRAMPRATVVSR
ncbi:MAG TPA: hypothetical protein VF516_36635 [Kofleriaceae bacterium]